MSRASANAILMAIACGVAASQPLETRPQFEVASVKLSAPPEQRSGPRPTGKARTPDPGLFICDSCTLFELVMSAYRIQPYQISAPGWMESERFTVHARVPAGTTADKLMLMQQRLLAERFHLTSHHEEKEMQRCELLVAKGGPRLKSHVREESDTDGHEPGATITPDGRINARWRDLSMAEFAGILSRQIHLPVTDATGLQGTFDFTLSWVMDQGEAIAPPDADSAPTIFSAVQAQLGLKLAQKKGPVDRLVIDHADKVPTGN